MLKRKQKTNKQKSNQNKRLAEMVSEERFALLSLLEKEG